MESKMEKLQVVELTVREQIEIDGGSQRKDAKLSNWWNMITTILLG